MSHKGKVEEHISESVRLRARELRREMTPQERKLWARLRGRQLAGLKFRRQHPIGRYIVDYYCPAHRLIIELEGGIHKIKAEEDGIRRDQLIDRGYRIHRVSNLDIDTDLESVLETIIQLCQ